MTRARHPKPGRTKTRLIPMLGQQAAASPARRLTLRTPRTAQTMCADSNRVPEVRCDGSSEKPMRHRQAPGWFRTTLTNHLIVQGQHLGVPLEKLEMWYRGRG